MLIRIRPIKLPINWDEQPLGEMPDMRLAWQLGVSNQSVGKARKRRGIPPYRSEQRGPGEHARINWDEQPLGKISDYELSAKLGVDRTSVRAARRTRGIPPIRPVTGFHRCPFCKTDTVCRIEGCDHPIDMGGGVFISFHTCQSCLDELAKQTNHGEVYVPSRLEQAMR